MIDLLTTNRSSRSRPRVVIQVWVQVVRSGFGPSAYLLHRLQLLRFLGACGRRFRDHLGEGGAYAFACDRCSCWKAGLRQRRTLLGMSQTKLAGPVALTFRQIQKYERGSNRMGSSRLFEFAKVLDVPVSFFFDEMPANGRAGRLMSGPWPQGLR